MITLEEIFSWIIHFAQTHTPLATVGLVVLLAVTYFNPKPMFRIYAFVAFVAVVIYGLSIFSAPMHAGTLHKVKMGNKSLKVIDE